MGEWNGPRHDRIVRLSVRVTGVGGRMGGGVRKTAGTSGSASGGRSDEWPGAKLSRVADQHTRKKNSVAMQTFNWRNRKTAETAPPARQSLQPTGSGSQTTEEFGGARSGGGIHQGEVAPSRVPPRKRRKVRAVRVGSHLAVHEGRSPREDADTPKKGIDST